MEIKDDTGLSIQEGSLNLADSVGFQTIDPEYTDESDQFVTDVEQEIDDRRPLYESPWLRIVIALGTVVVVFFTVGFLFGGNEPEVAEETEVDEEPELTLTLDPEESEPSVELDQMRAEVALLEQQVAIQQVDRENARLAESQNEAETAANRAQTPPTPQRSTAVSTRPSAPLPPPRTVVSASPVTRTPVAPVRPPARTISTSAPRSAPIPAYRPPASATAASVPMLRTEPVEVDDRTPEEKWYDASNSGIMGSMPAPESAVVESSEPVQVATAFGSNLDGEPNYVLKNANYKEYETIAQDFVDPVPGLRAARDLVPMGTYASAQVTTPIVWGAEESQFMLELTDDVYTNTNQIAIPKGAFVVVQPGNVNNTNGQAELAVVGISINGEVFPIDYGVVTVNAKDGNPLIAKKYGDVGRSIASNDFEMFAIGALAGIGEELTRADSETITNSAYGSTVSRSGNTGNVLGGILAGGAGQLTDRMAARNDARMDEIGDRNNIWFLPAGTELEIYFNQDLV